MNDLVIAEHAVIVSDKTMMADEDMDTNHVIAASTGILAGGEDVNCMQDITAQFSEDEEDDIPLRTSSCLHVRPSSCPSCLLVRRVFVSAFMSVLSSCPSCLHVRRVFISVFMSVLSSCPSVFMSVLSSCLSRLHV